MAIKPSFTKINLHFVPTCGVLDSDGWLFHRHTLASWQFHLGPIRCVTFGYPKFSYLDILYLDIKFASSVTLIFKHLDPQQRDNYRRDSRRFKFNRVYLCLAPIRND
jgi:hypothetical protein